MRQLLCSMLGDKAKLLVYRYTNRRHVTYTGLYCDLLRYDTLIHGTLKMEAEGFSERLTTTISLHGAAPHTIVQIFTPVQISKLVQGYWRHQYKITFLLLYQY
jgi:hypothetical protein